MIVLIHDRKIEASANRGLRKSATLLLACNSWSQTLVILGSRRGQVARCLEIHPWKSVKWMLDCWWCYDQALQSNTAVNIRVKSIPPYRIRAYREV